MKKFFTLVFFTFFIVNASFAQERKPIKVLKKDNREFFSGNLLRRQAPTCTVLNYDPDIEDYLIYMYEDDAGFVAGTNIYADQEVGAAFQAPADALYLTKVAFAFAYANSNIAANLSKTITFKVYNIAPSGDPGTLLSSATLTLGDIKAKVDNSELTEIIFPTPVVLPDDKKFAISMDISNLTWDPPTEVDTLALTVWDVNASDENFLIYSGGIWVDGSFANPLTYVRLSIFPLVSDDPACLDPTPVKLSSFEVQNKNGYNELTWTTETEQNNAGFEVQRSADGSAFSAIASVNSKVPSGNSSTKLSYRAQDNRPLSGINYYRLLQRDLDGKVSLSKVISIIVSESRNSFFSVYPNPATHVLNIRLHSNTPQKGIAQVLNMQGAVLIQKSYDLRMGETTLNINVESLPKGSYLIKVTDAGETQTLKFVK